MSGDGAAIEPPPPGELPRVIEALLFVSDEPQTPAALARATGVGEATVRRALQQLRADYEARGLRIMDDGHRYQLVTASRYAAYVDAFIDAGPSPRLTRAALETLTIIAYRQPCSRGEVAAVRGINSDKLVANLEQRGLIDTAGYGDSPGKPRLYRTTIKFLEHFGLQDPAELPALPIDETDEVAAEI